MNTVKTNEIIRGTFGRVWVNDELWAEVKSFEGKLTLSYEEADISNDMGKHQRYMGFSGEGTMTVHKVNSKITNLLAKGVKTGVMPEVSMVGKLDDPTALGAERIKFSEVTFDEVMLLKFENKALMDQEIPFKFADFDVIDSIS